MKVATWDGHHMLSIPPLNSVYEEEWLGIIWSGRSVGRQVPGSGTPSAGVWFGDFNLVSSSS